MNNLYSQIKTVFKQLLLSGVAFALSWLAFTPAMALGANLPDLTVNSIYVVGNDLTAKICNSGSGMDFRSLRTEFFIHETYNLSGERYANEFYGSLAFGQCAEVSVPVPSSINGHKIIDVTVDADYKIEESSEANNKKGQSLYLKNNSSGYVAPTPTTPTPAPRYDYGYDYRNYDYGRPYYDNYRYPYYGPRYDNNNVDLVIKNIGVTQNVADQYIEAEICNDGREDATNRFTIEFVVDNKRFSKEQTGTFVSNSCRDFQVKISNLTSGYKWIDAYVDAGNSVAESNESNNSASRYLYIHDTELNPDLGISTVSFVPHRDGGMNAEFEYCNYGGPTTQTYEIMLKVDGKRFTSKESRLGTDRCVTSNLYLGNLSGGVYSYELILDRADVIAESNESNNTRTGQFSVDRDVAPTVNVYNGDLVKSPYSSHVYWVNNGYKYWIPSMDIFNHNGYSWAMIRTVSQSTIDTLKDGGSIGYNLYASGTLIKSANNPAVFIMDGTNKRLIRSEAEFTAAGYDWNKIITVSEGYLSAVPNK